MQRQLSTLAGNKEGPGAWGGGHGPGPERQCGRSVSQSSTLAPAVAIQVYRPSLNRWATVAKMVQVDGELVLAIPYRRRQRLKGRVSLPLRVVRFAQAEGAEAIVVRFDDEGVAYRLPLEEALRMGERGMVDGEAEAWWFLAIFEEAPWPAWAYATKTIRLGPGPEERPRQLVLEEVPA